MRLNPFLLAPFIGLVLHAGSEDTGIIPKAARKDASAFGFSDGRTRKTVADYRGKVVVIDFWATWCPPCRQSLPELAHLQRQEPKAPIAIIPVNRDDEGWSVVTPFIHKNAKVLGDFRAYMAGVGKNGTAVLGEVTAFPTTYIIDADGKVASRWTGYAEGLLVERLNAVLRELPAPAKGD